MLISVPYLVACFVCVRDAGALPSSRLLWAAFLTASIPAVFAPPLQSHDLYQYLFYGKLAVVHHANPFLVAPHTHAGDPWFRTISWPNTRSAYGPVWIALMSLIVWLTRGSLAAAIVLEKALCLVAAVSAVVLLHRLPRRDGEFGLPQLGLLVFGLSPLVVSSVPLGGHADAAVALAFVSAMVADSRERTSLAAVLLAIGSLVKLYAMVPLVLYLFARAMRNRRRAAGPIVLAVAVLVLGYLPYWGGLRTLGPVIAAGGRVSSSLAGTVATWLTSLFRTLGLSSASRVATAIVDVLGAVVVALTAVHLIRTGRTRTSIWTACAILLGAVFLVTPWYLPWYLVSLLALVAPLANRFVVLTVTTFGTTSLAQVPEPTGIVRTTLRYLVPPLAAWGFLARGRARTGATAEPMP
jgi:hypothetical protein